MPVVACAKCSSQLKIPDGAKGNVKCPRCGNIFPVKAPATPAFEVVDDAPAPAPKPAAVATRTAPATRPAASDEPDFEVVDEKPKKRVVAVSDDDDDDRPRKNRRDDDDDDDDDDRPRSKKRRDDDRPKKKAKKKRPVYDDEDDDDEEYWQPRSNRGAFGKGKVGALLLSISFWLNMGAYGLLALYALIGWLMLLAASSSSGRGGGGRGGSGGGGDGSFMDVIVILPGLLGLGAWIVGTIGCSFSIAGPARARGMAITATVFAAIHLILTGVTFSNLQDGLGIARGLPGVGKVAWIVVASTLPALDAFLPMLFYNSKGMNGEYVIALLAGVSEVLRLAFSLLTLRALAGAAKDQEAWARAQVGMLSANFVIGGVVVFTLLMTVLMAEGKFKSFETYAHLICATVFLTYLAYTAMMFLPAIAAMIVKDACARRA